MKIIINVSKPLKFQFIYYFEIIYKFVFKITQYIKIKQSSNYADSVQTNQSQSSYYIFGSISKNPGIKKLGVTNPRLNFLHEMQFFKSRFKFRIED